MDKKSMTRENLINDLNIENKDILLEFLVAYARFEYALKKLDYLNLSNGDAKANWEKFISENKDKFDPSKNKELEDAVRFLLDFPAKRQIVKDKQLVFETHPETRKGPDICRLYHCIRIVRNNLFHGGKFSHGPEPELSRNKALIENSLIVLNDFLQLDKELRSVYWKTDY
jgi:hypothetical protein